MKKTLFMLLLLSASVCVAQRHPYNSRPYHPPDRPREMRRQPVPPQPQQQKPQPVNTPAPKQDKRGK